MTPSEEIATLARTIVDERMTETKQSQKAGAISFFKQIAGISDADISDAVLKEPMTWIAAILRYLDTHQSDICE